VSAQVLTPPIATDGTSTPEAADVFVIWAFVGRCRDRSRQTSFALPTAIEHGSLMADEDCLSDNHCTVGIAPLALELLAQTKAVTAI
jgi:hypothetical protein